MEKKHILKMELLRIWSQKSTYLVLLILMAWTVVNLYLTLLNDTVQNTVSFEHSAFSAMSFMTNNVYLSTFLFFIFPLIISLVASSSSLSDCESGRLAILLQKCGTKIFVIRASAIMISTFTMVIIPYILEQVIVMSVYPLKTFLISSYVNTIYIYERFSEFTYFSTLYENAPYLLNLICILLYGVYAVSIALFCYAVSLLVGRKIKKNIAIVLIPLSVIVVNLILNYVSPHFPIILFSYKLNGDTIKPPWYYSALWILLTYIISFGIIWWKSKRKRDEI